MSASEQKNTMVNIVKKLCPDAEFADMNMIGTYAYDIMSRLTVLVDELTNMFGEDDEENAGRIHMANIIAASFMLALSQGLTGKHVVVDERFAVLYGELTETQIVTAHVANAGEQDVQPTV